MPLTYQLISSTTITSPVSLVSFTSIPQTYTDLVLRVSARNSGAAIALNLYYQPYAFTVGRTTLLGDGTTASAGVDSADAGIYIDQGITGTNETANTFNNAEYYIANYAVSGQHFTTSFHAQETNGATAYITLNGSVDTNSTTYSQIDLNPGNNFVAGSSFYLYGIKKN